MARGVHVVVDMSSPKLDDVQNLLEDLEAKDIISGLSIIGTQPPMKPKPKRSSTPGFIRSLPSEGGLCADDSFDQSTEVSFDTTKSQRTPKGTSRLFIFRAKAQKLSVAMEELEKLGVGRTFGTVDLFELTASKPLVVNLGKKKRKYEIHHRRPVEEIFCQVDDGAHLTFDYLCLIAMASMMAGIGLINDSSVTIVASMLVSPLMGPILAMTFGTLIGKFDISMRGLRNELYGTLLTWIVGFLVGVSTALVYLALGLVFEITNEMYLRGNWLNLFSSAFIALSSGIAVSIALTGGGVSTVVGVSIGVSLLPPLVNSGLCTGLGLVWRLSEARKCNFGADSPTAVAHYLRIQAEGRYQLDCNLLEIGLISWILYVENMIGIVIGSYFMLKMKKVDQLQLRSRQWDEESRVLNERLRTMRPKGGLEKCFEYFCCQNSSNRWTSQQQQDQQDQQPVDSTRQKSAPSNDFRHTLAGGCQLEMRGYSEFNVAGAGHHEMRGYSEINGAGAGHHKYHSHLNELVENGDFPLGEGTEAEVLATPYTSMSDLGPARAGDRS
jgi:uncharacterized hydrophobic protein (TIGR00271 family)